MYENYDPGETYGEYAGGGPISAFQAGGAPNIVGNWAEYDKDVNEANRGDFTEELTKRLNPGNTEKGLYPLPPNSTDPNESWKPDIRVAPPVIAEFYKEAEKKQKKGEKLTNLEQEILNNYFEYGGKIVESGPALNQEFFDTQYWQNPAEQAWKYFQGEKENPQGPYSSKMAKIWPEEFGVPDYEGEPDEWGRPPYIAPPKEHLFAFGGPVGGGSVKGIGSGMDDMVPATIEGRQMAKLSNDEFVIPADVVSQLGDGSSDAGHRKLYDFISNIRSAKTGNPQQPPKLMEALKGLNAVSRGKPQNTFISDVIKMKQAINPQGGRNNDYAAEYIRAIKSVMEAR